MKWSWLLHEGSAGHESVRKMMRVSRRRGHEARHWSSIGKATDSDDEIMAHARVHGYVVLTHDLDFGSILASTNADGPSVVQLRSNDVRLGAMGVIVLQALHSLRAELASGVLVTVDRQKTRARVLPLR